MKTVLFYTSLHRTPTGKHDGWSFTSNPSVLTAVCSERVGEWDRERGGFNLCLANQNDCSWKVGGHFVVMQQTLTLAGKDGGTQRCGRKWKSIYYQWYMCLFTQLQTKCTHECKWRNMGPLRPTCQRACSRNDKCGWQHNSTTWYTVMHRGMHHMMLQLGWIWEKTLYLSFYEKKETDMKLNASETSLTYKRRQNRSSAVVEAWLSVFMQFSCSSPSSGLNHTEGWL